MAGNRGEVLLEVDADDVFMSTGDILKIVASAGVGALIGAGFGYLSVSKTQSIDDEVVDSIDDEVVDSNKSKKKFLSRDKLKKLKFWKKQQQ
jgi:hypothetical protein